MKKIIFSIIILSNIILGQSGGQSNDYIKDFEKYLENASIMIGMNQSFYGTEWNEEMKDIEDSGYDIDRKPFRKLNFTLMNEFKHRLIGGVKYLNYGYDYKFTLSKAQLSSFRVCSPSPEKVAIKLVEL